MPAFRSLIRIKASLYFKAGFIFSHPGIAVVAGVPEQNLPERRRPMESILSKLKPEAAYFAPLEGKRGGMIFFDLTDPSQIVESVRAVLPWSQCLNRAGAGHER